MRIMLKAFYLTSFLFLFLQVSIYTSMSNKKSQVSQYKTWLEVDGNALRYNLRSVQKQVGKNVMVMAIVKSNAYGHGITEVAKELLALRSFREGGWFGVDSIDEALTLKKAGIKNPILILGYIPKPRLIDAVKNGFRFALYDADVLKESARVARKFRKKALVHIKLETGTYRQGILRTDLHSFFQLLKKYKDRIRVEGLYTHFADTENLSSSYYKEQLTHFEHAKNYFQEMGIYPTFFHTAASAALFSRTQTRFNMVRLGIALYGLYPSPEVEEVFSRTYHLQPVMSWKAKIAQVKEVPNGATIGYGRTFTALRPMKIALVPIGYADGFDRRFSNKGTVLMGGKHASVVGRVCMNIIMIDVSGISNVSAGEEVVIIGKQGKECLSAEDLAAKAGTINYEIISRINPLLPRCVQ